MPRRLTDMRAMLIASLLLLALTASADDFRYLLTQGSDSTISGNIDLDRLFELRDRWTGTYLWAQRNGRQYLIRDAATLAEVRAAFAPADELHDDYERLSARMRPVEKRESELERKIDRITDAADDGRSIDERQLQDLERQLEQVQRELRALEEEEERLDQQEEKLVDAAEKKLRQIVDRAVARGVAVRVR